MSALTSDDDEETVNLVSATITFSSCALLFGLKRKGVILWHCDDDNRRWYRRCNNIVSYEYLWIRRTCDFI